MERNFTREKRKNRRRFNDALGEALNDSIDCDPSEIVDAEDIITDLLKAVESTVYDLTSHDDTIGFVKEIRSLRKRIVKAFKSID